MQAIAAYITPTLLFPLAAATVALLFFSHWWSELMCRPTALERVRQWVISPRMSFAAARHPMERRDALPLLLLTAVYAFSAFWGLGARAAPQSFQSFADVSEVTVSLDREVTLTGVTYYTGLGTGEYTLEASADGQTWQALPRIRQTYATLFKWQTLEGEDKTPLTPMRARYLRLTALKDSLELGELALYGTADGGTQPALLDLSPGGIGVAGADALFDEQEVIPAERSYLTSSYFDEIYHARTAYEHIRGVYPYEVSHPPLGKLLIGLGIRAFGMTPFGWRFVGTLFGVLMLPLLYLFLKNLFGKTPLALCGTSLFAFDFMHLTQTRIATIDTYAVFFTLAMYFFLWRFLSLPAGTPFRRCAPSLLLSGLMFGLGAACKWTVLYGGAGMAVLYAVNLWQKRRDWPGELTGPTFASWAGKTVLFSVLAFVVLPLCVYVVAYLPYAQARGDTSLSNLLTIVWENQKFMFTYHRGVDATHPYASKWWQWMLDLRPILYYREHTAAGLKSAFAAFNNPVVSWLGLLCMGAMAIKAVRFRSGTALFLLVGYLAQLLPWLPISRPTFAYHYFPATLFLALGIASLMNDLMERPQGRWRLPVYGVTGLNAGLYGLFYPVLIGIPIPAGFSTCILRWLPSWPL